MNLNNQEEFEAILKALNKGSDLEKSEGAIWCARLTQFISSPNRSGLDGNVYWEILAALESTVGVFDIHILVPVYRALIDLLRTDGVKFLPSRSLEILQERQRLLTHVGSELTRWGDTLTARSIQRQIAQMYLMSGRIEEAFSQLENTIQWLRELTVLNQLQQAECLERLILRNGPHDYVEEKMCLVESMCGEAGQGQSSLSLSLCSRLFHSAALLELASNETGKALVFMQHALNLLKSNQEDPDTTLLVISSALNLYCRLGNLAEADDLFFQGQSLLSKYKQVISPVSRFTYRQNAAGYLYRVGIFREAQRLYQLIDLEDSGGRIMGHTGVTAVLSSKGLIARKRGYLRRAGRYIDKAIAMLDRADERSIQSGKLKIQKASVLMDEQSYETALDYLLEAREIFALHHSIEDMARAGFFLGRCYLKLRRIEQANDVLAESAKLLENQSLRDHELLISLSAIRSETAVALTDYVLAEELCQQTEQLFLEHKNRFKFIRSRLKFGEVHRNSLIEGLSLPGRSIEDRWNLVLKLLENDRADLFADSLSYYVRAVNHPETDQLYQSYLELQGRYLDILQKRTDDVISPELETIQEKINETIERVFKYNENRSAYLMGRDVTIDQITTLIDDSDGSDSMKVAAYIMSDKRIHIVTLDPKGDSGQPVLDHVGVSFDSDFILDFELKPRLRQIRDVLTDTLQVTGRCLSILMRSPKIHRPPELEQFEEQYKTLRRLSRRKERSLATLRTLVESCVYAMNSSFLLVKVCRYHPELKDELVMVHYRDRIVFETLYDILLRPIDRFFTEDTEFTVMVSEVLTRIPFEALIDRNQDLPDGYFIFPQRSVNYYRSPWLFTEVYRNTKKSVSGYTDETISEQQLLTLFTPLEPEVAESVDAYHFKHLIQRERDRDRDVVLKWLGANDATRTAFQQTGPDSNRILVETHCLFERLQPFLSRLLFADNEPLTAMDIFAEYTFNITVLMILVACESDQLYDTDIDRVGVSVAEVLLCKGVHRIVAPMWTVEMQSSRELIRRFVNRISQGIRPVDAMATAQREHAVMHGLHPYFWAGFSFSGRPEND